MVIKLYISGISGNKEVKKKQQRVQMILDSKQINYEAIDITEPGKEKDKEFMQQNGKVRESLGKYPLPPQIFNDDDFCGDYEDFDLANEVDELEKFLHIETSSKDMENGSKQSVQSGSVAGEFFDNNKKSNDSLYNPYDYHTLKIRYDSVNGLKEEIVISNDLIGEKEQTEENTKTEVNGETENVPSVEPSSQSLTENLETSEEVVAPENKETSIKETESNESQENVEDTQEHEVEQETEEKEEEKEDVESPKEEEVENSVKSPLPEDKEEEEETEVVDQSNDNNEKMATEEEEEQENDEESPEAEKSEEE